MLIEIISIIFYLLLFALIVFYFWYPSQIKIPDKYKEINIWNKMFKTILQDDQLMKLSIIKEGVHIEDFTVYNDRTLHTMSDDRIIDISRHDFKMLKNVENTLQVKSVHGCADGTPGTFWLVRIHGKEPMHMYGSICMDKPYQAARLFVKFCRDINDFI
jgi:hypothetical protein